MLTPSRLAHTLLLSAVFAPCFAQQEPAAVRQLSLVTGKSTVVESPVEIRRAAVANPAVLDVMAITSKELLVNALSPGDTSLILWSKAGDRVVYEVKVQAAVSPLDQVREQLSRELGDQKVTMETGNGAVFLRGTVKDQISADRAVMIAGSIGKVVNLLYVEVPPAEAQILLKVRFANVDRTASLQLGANIISTGAANNLGTISTGQFTPPTLKVEDKPIFTLSDALNLFLFRPDLNLGATIKALQSRNLLEILAEPNVLTIDRKAASFIAGGQFPFPTVQGGANAGAVTISFREYGIRISFLPVVTPRGTIRLHVTPEVSALDFANGLLFQGFTIPAISTRRVDTEVELENGQSFAIAGLLDNRTTESLSKIPGISSIPILGKLFQSINRVKTNSELLIIITPEIVQPILAGQTLPQIEMPRKFMADAPGTPPQNPAGDVNGTTPVLPHYQAIPIELLRPRPAEAGSGSQPPSISLPGIGQPAEGAVR